MRFGLRTLQRVTDWFAERMERRLFVVFLFLIILPIGALGYFSAQRYTASIEQNTVSYMSQVSDKMISKLDDYMQDMKKISIIPSYLDPIKEGLRMSNRFYESRPLQKDAEGTEDGILTGEEFMRLKIRSQVEGSIYFMNNIKEGTNTVYLFDRYGHAYYVLKNQSVRGDLDSIYETWKNAAYEAGGTAVLLSTQEVAAQSSKRYVFTVVREIIDTTYESLGLIAVDANIGVIENIVRDLDRVTRGTTLIIDDAGRVIFDSEKKFLTQNIGRSELLRRATGSEGSFRAVVDGQPVLTIYKRSNNTGWKVLTIIPHKQLVQEAYRNRNFTLLMSLGVIVFALLISLVLTFTLTRPLRSLVRAMKAVQTGNLDVTFTVKRRDEAGLVGNAFNRMIDRVKSLIEDVYLAGQRKKEAELEALQSQINPHFIYNTLEAIRMTAVMNDDHEVSSMTQLLGKLLRYGIGTGMETVPLAKEFEHLSMYVELLNYRYGNKFILKLPDDSVDLDMPIMKLLFQPIVENAVYHGLDDSKSTMGIVISYRFEGTDHVFTVRDNGAGMNPETLERLRYRLLHGGPSSGKRGIGLRNVNERLKLLFGQTYGIGIASSPGEGTLVTVRFPAVTEEGEGPDA